MKKILIQLDTDNHSSSFDRVVAIDSEVDQLFSYDQVTPENVTGLVHGAMFTRGIDDLKNTAIFIGGSQVSKGEELFQKVQNTFFGPVKVSVMMDSNGSNTTAAAAVLCAGKHISLNQSKALVLGATGPVGERVVQLLASEGAEIKVSSRKKERAQQLCDRVREQAPKATLIPSETSSEKDKREALDGVNLIISAGAAGVQFYSESEWKSASSLKLAIDLNAVPPAGLEGIDMMDKAKEINGILTYGAIGVGGFKMKIHKACLKKLFTRNDLLMETQSIYQVGQELLSK
jgi:methylenetetrahydrofolate/methylenetetrahydromethanopterin dehydrogenase (NADP+)